MKTGIVLSGGGARGAYQAGAIKALCEICVQVGVANPFQVISGLSAGSLNASYLASHADDLAYVGPSIAKLWGEIETDKVVNISPFEIGRIGARLFKQFMKNQSKSEVKGLMDTTPLYELIKHNLRYSKIDENIHKGALDSLAITATNYSNSYATTFVQTKQKLNDWSRVRRDMEQTHITADHIMASSAIPLVFPSVEIKGSFYGDGSIRNTSPLSPAIHLGVDRLIVVGVRMKDVGGELSAMGVTKEPSMAHVMSVLIHGLLMDAIDLDIERLERINEMSEAIQGKEINGRKYNRVDYLWLSPSKYLGSIAAKYEKLAPTAIRLLLSGLGKPQERADLFSYLLFEKEYMRELVELGYADTLARKGEVLPFLTGM